MEFRRQVITAQAGLAAVIAATAIMTIVALSSTASRGVDAHRQLARDLQLRDHVRRSAMLLADATRRYATDGSEVQRTRIVQLQRELDPSADRLAARARELGAPNHDRLEPAIDGHVAWLSAIAAARTVAELDRALASRSSDLERQLAMFCDAAEESGARTVAKAERLARRAQIGVVVTSILGIAMGLVLGLVARRRIERFRHVERAP